MGLNLTGYYKLYVAKKSIRIVYRIMEWEVIVEVVAIGKREDLEVYREAIRRILKA
ncbi:MAG: plasmid stabilization system [Nitrospira sp.]|nr:plasmid stabilization system [Nitrospira sp.]